MTYDPETYWPERLRRQGETYVAKGGRRDSYERQIRLVTPYFDWLPAEGRVLDFGCGPGRFRPALEARGLEYEGVDLIPGLGTMELEDVEPASFDCAVAIWVLQHIVEDEAWGAAIEALYQALMPGGTLLVVDHLPLRNMAEHMHPRGYRGLARFHGDYVTQLDDDSWVGVCHR